jgi:hypothetical protein
MYERLRTVVSECVVSSAPVSCPAVLRHGSASVDLEFIAFVLTPWSRPACEAKSPPASQISRILWSLKFHYCVRKNPPFVPSHLSLF